VKIVPHGKKEAVLPAKVPWCTHLCQIGVTVKCCHGAIGDLDMGEDLERSNIGIIEFWILQDLILGLRGSCNDSTDYSFVNIMVGLEDTASWCEH
jgi:hypothetical protein